MRDDRPTVGGDELQKVGLDVAGQQRDHQRVGRRLGEEVAESLVEGRVHVAKAAGISRQTIYNEFGSRQGLAQAYAMRLADRLVDQIDDAIVGNEGDVYAAFLQGFRDFFTESAADPLVISLLTGDFKPDLLQLITTDSGPIITHCSQRLTSTFVDSWVKCSDEDAGVLARAIVRLAMSYVSMPPEQADLGVPPARGGDVAHDLARLMTPFAERYGVIDTS